MSYQELIHTYFERSVALQWYWTVYVLVIGGVLAFSAFRRQPELVTTSLVILLYLGFAWKNLGAIEATAEEREAIRALIPEYPASGQNAADITRTRQKLEPILEPYSIPGARYFHLACDLLTVIFLGAKEWLRRRQEGATGAE